MRARPSDGDRDVDLRSNRSIHNKISAATRWARGEVITCLPIFSVSPAFVAAIAVQVVVGEFAA